jgi:hypothetical protein
MIKGRFALLMGREEFFEACLMQTTPLETLRHGLIDDYWRFGSFEDVGEVMRKGPMAFRKRRKKIS